MKVRNIVRKAAVLGSSVALVGSTLMGALAYDLADYPDRFVVDGEFDGKIVVGERAATADVLGSIDIAASLQAASVTEESVDIPGVAGKVSLTGDAFRMETGSDLLELREALGAVWDTLTSSELEALEGGSITTDQGSTDYYQYLRFEDPANTQSLQAIGVNYVENEDDELGDFLVIDTADDFFEWEIEFTEGLESEIDANDELQDLEDETFNIFGTEFTFVDSSIDTSTDDITLSFMAGEVADTLREGETRTYSIDGVDYEITLVFVSDPSSGTSGNEAKFSVNGELTDSMTDGDTDTLSGGLQIGVRDLLVNSREGVVSFFLGADKVEFTDTNYGSSTNGGSIEIGNENIEDATVEIIGNELGTDSFEITSITYRLTADADVGSTLYVPPGHGVREYLDEPEGMLSPTFDLQYEGLMEVAVNPIEFDANGDDEYEVTATNLRGKTYSWPLMTTDGTWKWGDEDDAFWFHEATVDSTSGSVALNISAADFDIEDDDYFLVSENAIGAASEKDDSAVLQYDDIDTSERILYFNDMGTGETKSISYTADSSNAALLGVASNLVIEGNTYTVWVGNSTGYPIAVDLDGDSDLTGAQVGFTVKGGGTLNFDVNAASDSTSSTISAAVNMSLTVPESEFDDAAADEVLYWNIDEASATELTLALVEAQYVGPNDDSANEWSRFDVINDDSDDDYDRGMTDFGALVEFYNPSGDDAEELTIHMPETQRGAQVFVISGAVERSAGGAGSVVADKVNPIAVGLAVLDRDAPALGSENMIIVGGPCANSAAAAFLGNPANCAEGFEPGKAIISAKEFGSTVAALVAGYEATETQGASRVLASYADYALSGSEVEVVVADLNSITVQPVSAGMDDDMEETA